MNLIIEHCPLGNSFAYYGKNRRNWAADLRNLISFHIRISYRGNFFSTTKVDMSKIAIRNLLASAQCFLDMPYSCPIVGYR